MAFKGTLIPIGGNEDKGLEERDGWSIDFVQDGILSRVVSEAGGVDVSILVVTTASQIPKEVGAMYTEAFARLECTNVEILDIRESKEAEDPGLLKKVKSAACIMFSGGDQSRIVDIIGGTSMHDILLYRFQNESIVIAGTSAGAMAMSQEMISGGSSTEALLKGSIDMREGMRFIPGLIIDSHFIKRGRFGRLAEAVAQHPHLIGIGLAEDTGMIIKNGDEIKVIGSGMVIIFDPSDLSHNNIKILDEGTPMTMANLKVHVLANGDRYSISKKEVYALALDSAFE